MSDGNNDICAYGKFHQKMLIKSPLDENQDGFFHRTVVYISNDIDIGTMG